MKVAQKLMKARIELQKRQLKKTGRNEYSKYNYFELEDFLPTVQEIFNSLGLCGIVSFNKDIAVLTIIDSEEDGGCLEVTSPMADANLKGTTPIQNLGAVHTYMRRYLWVTAMEIVEHDAIDSSAPSIGLNEYIGAINLCNSLDELTSVYTHSVKKLKSAEDIKALKLAASEKKGQLNDKK